MYIKTTPATLTSTMKKKERYFGDPNTFAIRYIPGYTTKDKNHYYAYCHLVFNGQIIGDKTESCFLSSWLFSLERLRDQVKNNFDSIKHPTFKNRSDREIFELIYKPINCQSDTGSDISTFLCWTARCG